LLYGVGVECTPNIKPSPLIDDMLYDIIRIFCFGRLQTYARLMPGILGLCSKFGLDNRILPRINTYSIVAYLSTA